MRIPVTIITVMTTRRSARQRTKSVSTIPKYAEFYRKEVRRSVETQAQKRTRPDCKKTGTLGVHTTDHQTAVHTTGEKEIIPPQPNRFLQFSNPCTSFENSAYTLVFFELSFYLFNLCVLPKLFPIFIDQPLDILPRGFNANTARASRNQCTPIRHGLLCVASQCSLRNPVGVRSAAIFS